MSRKPYKRKQGEFELRVLKDGRVVVIAPDEALLKISQALEESGDPETAASDRKDAGPPNPAGQQMSR
jgi:hypothetical protein